MNWCMFVLFSSLRHYTYIIIKYIDPTLLYQHFLFTHLLFALYSTRINGKWNNLSVNLLFIRERTFSTRNNHFGTKSYWHNTFIGTHFQEDSTNILGAPLRAHCWGPDHRNQQYAFRNQIGHSSMWITSYLACQWETV